jgi:multicomponent Na+:H+ antiporter subunit A
MISVHSPIVAVGVRAVTPLAVVVAAYLFFAGHNQPGGGFSAGLVLGAVLSLRTVAGLYKPVNGSKLMAAGIIVAAAVALVPAAIGGGMLDMVVWSGELPLLGKVKTGTAAIFDIGVVLIVVGLVDAVLDGLGTDDIAIDTPAATGGAQ